MKKATLLLCVLAGTLAAQISPARLDAQAKAYFDQNQFNGSVLVSKGGVNQLNKGYGMANFEWGIPNGPSTKFRLGSITKQFTAMLILQLEQQGKLSVNDPISKHVPDSPASWQNITIHHLLTHTSGIPNLTSFPDYQKTMMMPSPPAESMKKFRDKPLDFDPGTKFSYSNSGYILLGLIVENVTGKKYADVLRDQILVPAGMNDTGYDLDTTLIPNRAAGYTRSPKGLANAAFIDMTIPHAAGAMYSTTEDLKKWDAILQTEKLLPDSAKQRYWTPFKDTYAYGWDVRKQDGVTVESHGGGINGFATMIIRIPEEKLLVVTLSNVLPSQAGKLANELVRLAEGKDVDVPKARKEISVAPEILDRYVGKYELRPDFVMEVTREGNQLMTQATGQGKIPIFAETETKFFPKVVDATITFQSDASGKVTGLVLTQGGREMPAKRQTP